MSLLIAVAGLLLGVLTHHGACANAPGTAQSRLPADVAAVVNGHAISMAALTERTAPQFANLELQIVAIKHQELRPLIHDILLRQEADRLGISREALVDRIKDLASITVSAEEITDFYEDNIEQFPSGEEASREAIRAILREKKASERVTAFSTALAEKSRIVVYLPKKPTHITTIPLGTLAEPPTVPPGPIGPPGVVADVNGTVIPLTALEARLPLLRQVIEKNQRKLRALTLDAMIRQRVIEQEMAKRGVTRDELFEAVTRASEIAISDQEVDAVYRQIKAPQESESALKAKIAARLRQRAAQLRWKSFVDGLRAGATVELLHKDLALEDEHEYAKDRQTRPD